MSSYNRKGLSTKVSIVARKELTTTPVYRMYWHFACERQEVFYRRLSGCSEPWTKDAILQKYKFTNSYRVLDRVSQFLVSDIINPDVEMGVDDEEKIFRILLYKIFNKIETWELLERDLGRITWKEYSFKKYNDVLSGVFRKGGRIYSAAYIMASGRSVFGNPRKHQNHLRLLENIMEPKSIQRVVSAGSMADLYNVLLSFPLIGTFLAYQYATDLNYSDVFDFSEDEFVVAGPGAKDGICKCFTDSGNYSDEDVIRFMMDNQDVEFKRFGLNFKSLFGRPLMLIDCQNIFCEVGKYARVSHPEIKDKSGRTKIKQGFRSKGVLPIPQFPKKWGLSRAVEKHLRETCVRQGLF